MLREVVAPLCDGLLAVAEQRWDDAVRLIRPLLPRLDAGRRQPRAARGRRGHLPATHSSAPAGARRPSRLIDARLDRRPSPLDLRRRTAALAS